MYDVYLSSLDKYIYYVYNVQILLKSLCGSLRHDCYYSKPENICIIRDYAERTSANFEFWKR